MAGSFEGYNSNRRLRLCLIELGFECENEVSGRWVYKKDSEVLYIAYWGSNPDDDIGLVCITNKTTGDMSGAVDSVEKLKELFLIESRKTNLSKLLEE